MKNRIIKSRLSSSLFLSIEFIKVSFAENTCMPCCGSGPIFTGSGSGFVSLYETDPDQVDPKRSDPDPQHCIHGTLNQTINKCLGNSISFLLIAEYMIE